MEPQNHPLEKEKTSSKSSFLGSMLVFGGVKFLSDFFLGHKKSKVFDFFFDANNHAPPEAWFVQFVAG